MKIITPGPIQLFTVIFVYVIITGSDAENVRGIEYKNDKLIGTEKLYDNAGQWSATTNKYDIFLLAVEGATDRYNLGNGFFVGFQWYNDKYQSIETSINLQLYRFYETNSSYGQYEGRYTLVYESGFVKTEAGLNSYFFNESVRFDIQDNINDSYYIAFMGNGTGIIPVLTEMPTSCSGASNVVVETVVESRPSVGDILEFVAASTTFGGRRCSSYSLQGIFVQTHLASQNSGGCEMYIAHLDETYNITSHKPYPGSGFPSSSASSSVCQIIRAEREDYLIEIRKEDFELTTFSSIFFDDCSFISTILQVGQQETIDDTSFDLWGSYCGSKIFSSEESTEPYMKLTLITSSSEYGYTGYKFSINAVEDYRYVIIIIVVLLLVLIIVVTIIIVVCCCKKGCCSKTKGKVHSQNNQGTSQNNRMTQPTQPPQNRLPPIQSKANQQGMYGNQSQQSSVVYGNQNATIISMGGAGGQAAFVPPPAYNSVVSQPNMYNQPITNDPYGVPPPAVYIEPGQRIS